MKISEAAKTSKMAADMILVAVRDLKHPQTTLEAALWFMGEDFAFWAEIGNIPYASPEMVFKTQFAPRHARVLMARIRRILAGYDVIPEDSGWGRADVLRLREKVWKTLEGISERGKQPKRKKDYGQLLSEARYVNNKFIRLT